MARRRHAGGTQAGGGSQAGGGAAQAQAQVQVQVQARDAALVAMRRQSVTLTGRGGRAHAAGLRGRVAQRGPGLGVSGERLVCVCGGVCT